jgi:hypothetical protein
MLLAAIPTATPTIAERAQDYHERTKQLWLYDEAAKLEYIRRIYSVDDDVARAIIAAAYEIHEPVPVKQKTKEMPRCGYCARSFGSYREAWEHERTAHAMEQGLFAATHERGSIGDMR